MRFISKEFLVVFLTLLAISMMTPVTAAGDTWYVDDSGGADYTSIQAAVDASIAGDTIIVRDGTYTENVDINVAHLSILSENGSDSTIVQAADMSDHVFNVTKDYVNISGFTVEGATRGYTNGIYLDGVEHCIISDNTVSNNDVGILLYSSSNNTLTGNILLNNYFGISLGISSYNTLTDNTLSNNDYDGISLVISSYNTLTDNTVSNNFRCGIYLSNSSYNTLTDNTVSNNVENGIYLEFSSNNTLTNNIMSDNDYNFGVHGSSLSHYIHNIDTTNKVDGKQVYYWVGKQDQKIPDDAGYVGVVDSDNIKVEDLTLTNNRQGVLFAYTSNSKIENVNVSDNLIGIILYDSSETTLMGNTADSNVYYGIWLYSSSDNILEENAASGSNRGIYLYLSSNDNKLTGNNASFNNYGIYLKSSSNNEIYNNFLNNTNNAYDDGTNTWNISNTPGTNIIGGPYMGGNFWSDYYGVDTDEDGIGDSPYSIPSGSNQDMFPLTKKSVISCDSSGDEKNLFMPGEGIYVKAERVPPNTRYYVWIQDNPVSDGDTLNTSEDPSGGQEIVITDGNGSIPPTPIWEIPSDAAVTHHEYDIVLDNQSGSDVGTYIVTSDRIDSTIAAGVTAPFLELTSIAMALMGIAVFLRYVRNQKEK